MAAAAVAALTIPEIVQLVSVLAPTVTNLIVSLAHPDGTQTLVMKIQSAEQLNAQNAQSLNALLAKAHS